MERVLAAAVGIVIALVAAGVVAAAVSSAYTVSGVEVSATSTVGTFVGTGVGSGGDRLSWKVVVVHDPLTTSAPAPITDGSLAAVSVGNGVTALAATFTGGTVSYDSSLSSPAACGNQVYDVDGSLNFAVGATGPWMFSAHLTHYRVPVFGRCVTYAATVSGSLMLAPVK